MQTLFNTHYHTDQTGNNEIVRRGWGEDHRTRTHPSVDVDRLLGSGRRSLRESPSRKLPGPPNVFETTGSLKAGDEQIDYGYLPLAHTSGDIYVYFKTSNVLAAGDVASPLRDPALDYFTGAWIGGRVDAMDTLLKLGNEQTKIVPAYGPVMTPHRIEGGARHDGGGSGSPVQTGS